MTKTAHRVFTAFIVVLVVTAGIGIGFATLPATVRAAPGDVLYRANSGGQITISDGPDWLPAIDYLVAGGGQTSSHGQPATIDSSVPTGTPSEIWNTERWDPAPGDEMQYEFSVASGQRVEVRLYFYDGYPGTGAPGDRVFDVSVEDQTVQSFDIIEQYGDDTGAMKSFTVVSDGTIDIDFAHVTENPQINAIEIVESEPRSDELGAPPSVNFGTVVTGDSELETVTLTNLGETGDPSIDVTDVSLSGTDASEFSHDFSGSQTLAPGESMDVHVTFAPSDAQAKAATLDVTHSGTNSPASVSLEGDGSSTAVIGFGKSSLGNFGQGSLTALEFGPDDRLYVAKQNGMVYALEVTRNGPNSYSVDYEKAIGVVQDIPNHDDNGVYNSAETNRQITGLTVGGTAAQPVVYVSSSDPTIKVGADDDSVDTNSGAISRLTLDWGDDGELADGEIDHDVMVLGLPRSEENHATNGLALSDDGNTLFVAQGGHANKGAPSNNFGHTPEYALSAAVLEIDLAQIEADSQAKNLYDYDSTYNDVDFLYAIPTVQSDDSTDGDDLPFGGDDGLNQAKLVENGPVQVWSPGYRNPYDLVLTDDNQLYVIDNGPNGGWGGQPVGDGTAMCTNAPNEDGSYGTGDQLHLATEGSYGGHAAPIRGNPDGAGLYDASGAQYHDFTSADSPVPFDMANPVECDYQDPTEDNSIGDTFGWTGGIDEYSASNFGGQMQGDLLVVVNAGSVERVELNAAGDDVTNQEGNFFSGMSALGIDAQGDDGPFPGTVWTARNDVTVFEPNDYEDGGGQQCTAADDPNLDEDNDGYDNADELDAGTLPCSAASTPADFDGDMTSNVNDPDDDNDGTPDTADPFAIDPDDGTSNSLPNAYSFADGSYPGTIVGLGFTGLMTNGQDDYQDLYDPDKMTSGGAAEVLTVEEVPNGDAVNNQNNQQYAFQVGVNAPDEPFVIESTVTGFPDSPQNFQAMGIYLGTGDQDNYAKLVVSANGGTGGVQFAKETGGSFSSVEQPDDASVNGPATETTLYLTVDPATDPTPNDGTDHVQVTAEYAVDGGEKTLVGTTGVPASWLDSSDGSGLAVGVIATSYNADSTFDATWQDLSIRHVTPPANQPPTADAGADIAVDEGQAVQLDASGSSDPEGETLGYTWTQTAGSPSVQVLPTDAVDPTFTAPDVDGDATLTFQVSVSDGENSDTDTVDVTIQDADGTGGEMTLAEAVASAGDGDDSKIAFDEVQTAINWWQTGAEVPNTGGQTVEFADVQNFINLWQTDATVGDGGGTAVSSSLVEVTPGSTNVDETTYGKGSYQVTNTGETEITSVSFDLSTASMPDVVFDPQGTAGDPTGEGFNIASDGGTGITTAETANGDYSAFSGPHNGNDADDGFDVMTVEFDDFQNGETATFWADNDPTSIKGSTVGSQEAGPVSGLELAGATITVTYADGTTQTSQLMGDGSVGGSTATVDDSEAPAPTIGVDGISLDGSVLDSRHSGATVSEASQTVTVTGQPGETVTLVRVEGELTLSNVPDADGDGEPGYEIEELEANNAEGIEYTTVTLDSNGEATVPVTLTNTDADGDDNAGYNYFVAAHGEPSADAGLASNVVVLKYDETADDGSGGSGAVVSAVNAGGNEYTAADGTVFAADAGFTGGSPYSISQAIDGTEDDPLYQTERYGDFGYSTPVDNGQYEVTLYFAEIYQGTSQDNDQNADQTGQRLFDVSIEGQEMLSEYDIYATAGDSLTATSETFTVDVADGELNIDFSTVADNAKVSGIEVAKTDGSSGGEQSTSSADIAVTSNGGIDTSTFGSNSFQITNTGETNIASLSFDLSTGVMPDMVFDPDGTAGDSGAKGFTPDSGGSATGQTTHGFTSEHNGVDADDGYDGLTVGFDDFQTGETFGFSVDNDPTSIKNAQGTGAAGSVSGLELSGATVTIEYVDGTTQTTTLFGDGSDGGSQATASPDVPSAPTIGVDGVTLDESVLDSRHSGAMVSDSSQTITVSGEANQQVTLLRIEGQLELANDASGYEVEDFEANTAEVVEQQTVTLDDSGQATVSVTLTQSNSQAGYNYFVASAVDGDGNTGQTSNVVVLKQE